MGLTNWPGERIRRENVTVAKNYLSNEELDQLNRMVNQYLEFAELQAMNRKPMHMADWQVKLHGFLNLNDREILMHKGTVSHQQAEKHALKEFERYQKQITADQIDELDKAIKNLPAGKNKKTL
jgi:hypothetical protein